MRARRMVPSERRAQLLDTAEQLFLTLGYEASSVDMIIRAAGVSKGAFYHHFDSKESLLAALADRIVDRSIAQTREVMGRAHPDALSRLNAFWSESRRLKVEIAPVVRTSLRAVFRPENLLLRYRINAATIAKVAPVLAEVLEEGMREDLFDIPDAHGCAEMLLHLGTGVHDTIAWAIEESERGGTEDAAMALERRLRLFELAFNRVLGLPDDAVSLVEPGFAKAVVALPPDPTMRSSR